MKQRRVFGGVFGRGALTGAVVGLVAVGTASPSWAFSDKEEAALGREMSHMADMMGGVLPASHPMSRRVEKIGKRFAALARPRTFAYRYRVLDNPHVLNAFAAPGGTIYITSRLVKFTRSEDELASILGHETAHVSQRHIAQEVEDRDAFVSFSARLQQMRRAAAPASPKTKAGSKAGKGSSSGRRAVSHEANRRATSRLEGGSPWANMTWFLVSRGKARGMETEADTLSARWMRRLGYNPRAAITLLQHAYSTAPSSPSSPLSSLLSSHPGIESRVRDLRELIEREKLDPPSKVRPASKPTSSTTAPAKASGSAPTTAAADVAAAAAQGAPLPKLPGAAPAMP